MPRPCAAPIRRAIEDNVLAAARGFKAVPVLGARQTGKSAMLAHIFPDRRHVSLEDPFIVDYAKENPGNFLDLYAPPVLLDGVQDVPELFRHLKLACDRRDQRGLYCMSGSQPGKLLERVSDSLAGRVCILELEPLSMREILGDPFARPFLPTADYVLEHHRSVRKSENIWALIHRGGYPELWQNPALDWQQFYARYLRANLERDVRELCAVRDLDAFRKFMAAVAARTGQMVHYADIANEVGRDAKTVRKWMSILEATGIVYLLQPYTSAVLKRAVQTPKVYFRDTGLACYLTRWLTPETLEAGTMAGKLYETFVVSEILKSYSNRGIDYRYCVSYYRGGDTRRRKDGGGKEMPIQEEIHLILEEDGVLYPVEIRKNTSEQASAAAAFPVLDKVPGKRRGQGAVVSLCPEPGLLRENVLEIPAWFL